MMHSAIVEIASKPRWQPARGMIITLTGAS